MSNTSIKLLKQSHSMPKADFDFENNDIWPVEILGLKANHVHHNYYLNFERIYQP